MLTFISLLTLLDGGWYGILASNPNPHQLTLTS